MVFLPTRQAALLLRIRRYDSSYELQGTARKLCCDGILQLGNHLFQTQLAFLNVVNGRCVADHQLYIDTLSSIDQSSGLVHQEILGITQPLQPTDEELLEPRYRIYQENGGALTFAEWQLEGISVDDDAENSCEPRSNHTLSLIIRHSICHYLRPFSTLAS